MNPDDQTRPRRTRNVSPEMREAARVLRKNMTPAEQRLWDALRRGALSGLRFRKQHPMGTFVLDFYCPSHKLVVEVDGAVHDQPDVAEHDALREQALRQQGCHVVRVQNAEVMTRLDAVLDRIFRAADQAQDKEERG